MRKKLNKNNDGLRYMVAAAFFFSLMSLIVKTAGQRLPSSQIVCARSVVSLVICYVLLKRAHISLWGRRRSLLLLRGIIGFGGLFCFFYAVTKLPLADVTVIHFTNPVFTALLAALFLKETMEGREILGLLLSVAGVILVAQPAFLFGAGARALDLFAVMVALSGSLFSAGAYTTIRKLGATEHHLVVIFYFAVVATPASVPAMWADALWPTPVEWLLLLTVGIVTQIAQVFLTKGLHRERAGRAMATSYIQVVFASAWGFTFFNEVPTLLGAVGAALIFLGLLLVAKRA